MALDIRAMARAQFDPLNENGAYRAEKKRLRDADTASYAAQYALPGSIAERNDPNKFGSIASRFNGAFGPADPHALGGPYTDDGTNFGLRDDGTYGDITDPQTAASGLRRRKKPGVSPDDDILTLLGFDPSNIYGDGT